MRSHPRHPYIERATALSDTSIPVTFGFLGFRLSAIPLFLFAQLCACAKHSQKKISLQMLVVHVFPNPDKRRFWINEVWIKEVTLYYSPAGARMFMQ